MAANVVLLLLNDIYKLKFMWLFLNTVCYRVGAYLIVRDYFYYILFQGRIDTQITLLRLLLPKMEIWLIKG